MLYQSTDLSLVSLSTMEEGKTILHVIFFESRTPRVVCIQFEAHLQQRQNLLLLPLDLGSSQRKTVFSVVAVKDERLYFNGVALTNGQ